MAIKPANITGGQKSIVLTFSPDGTVDADAVGFTGVDCEKATKFIEEALGTKSSSKAKPERYAKNSTSVRN